MGVSMAQQESASLAQMLKVQAKLQVKQAARELLSFERSDRLFERKSIIQQDVYLKQFYPVCTLHLLLALVLAIGIYCNYVLLYLLSCLLYFDSPGQAAAT